MLLNEVFVCPQPRIPTESLSERYSVVLVDDYDGGDSDGP